MVSVRVAEASLVRNRGLLVVTCLLEAGPQGHQTDPPHGISKNSTSKPGGVFHSNCTF